MKLESLKSSKFEAMTNSQMKLIKGGYNVNTTGGPAYYQGRLVNTTSDVNVYHDDTNHWQTQILYLEDGSKIVISM